MCRLALQWDSWIILCNNYLVLNSILRLWLLFSLRQNVLFILCVFVFKCVCLTDRTPVRAELVSRSGPLHPPEQCWRSSTLCSLCPQSALSECRSVLIQESKGRVVLKWVPSMEEKRSFKATVTQSSRYLNNSSYRGHPSVETKQYPLFRRRRTFVTYKTCFCFLHFNPFSLEQWAAIIQSTGTNSKSRPCATTLRLFWIYCFPCVSSHPCVCLCMCALWAWFPLPHAPVSQLQV